MPPSTATRLPAAMPALPRAFRWVLPWLRREWPMWGRVYGLVGGTDATRWANAGVHEVMGKLHGYVMPLDLSNWSERLSWSVARYHDLPLQLALQRVLRPGDCFVDIGANIGMLTLLARHLVGEAGRVIACEPNPRLRARLEALLERNRLGGVELVAKALGEAPGTAELREFSGHTGWGSLAARGPDGAATTAVWQVPVVRGDDVLAAAPPGPMVLKIDVEGFEVPVLRGLRGTLAARSPAVLIEVAEAHQQRAGFSAAELRAELERLGYRGFALRTPRHFGFGRRLQLEPLADRIEGEIDALFVPPAGPMAARLG